MIDYVLRRPPAAERDAIEQSIERSLTTLDLLLAADMERAMMKIHVKAARAKPAPAAPPPTPEPPP